MVHQAKNKPLERLSRLICEISLLSLPSFFNIFLMSCRYFNIFQQSLGDGSHVEKMDDSHVVIDKVSCVDGVDGEALAATASEAANSAATVAC